MRDEETAHRPQRVVPGNLVSPSIRRVRRPRLLGTSGTGLQTQCAPRSPRVAAFPWRRIEGRSSKRSLSCPLAIIIAATYLLTAPAAAQTPTPIACKTPCTAAPGEQCFDLVPGWNAIYLNVQPAVVDPKVVFAGLPVRSVWTSGRDPNTVQFVCEGSADCGLDPVQQAALRQRGWIAYVPPGSDAEAAIDAAGNRLAGIYGNRAFLIDLGGSAPVTLRISGQPMMPMIAWKSNTFSLTGFPIDPAHQPMFADYFAGSDAHRGQDMYRLLPSGVWERIAVPERTCMHYGEAYWIYSATGSEFIAPLALDDVSTQGLDYARSIDAQRLRFTNLSNVPITIAIKDLGSPPVPLSYQKLNTTPGPTLGQFEWLPLGSILSLPASAHGTQSANLAVRRKEFSSASVASILAIADGVGSRWLVPLQAQKEAAGSGAGGGAAAVAKMAGLWAGTATINLVSEPQSGSMVTKSTVGIGSLCGAGSNFGKPCTTNADCPGSTCATARGGNTCNGGAKNGLGCANGGDCPGLCAAAPKNCDGGARAQLPCTADADCLGASCRITGVCEGGSNPGQFCSTVGVCSGGANDGGVCTNNAACPPRPTATATRTGGAAETATPTATPSLTPTRSGTPGPTETLTPTVKPTPTQHCELATCGAQGVCNTTHTQRCLGGAKANQPCSASTDCPATCDASDAGSEFQLRLLIHVNSDGKARLLKQVIQLWQNGQSTIGANGVEKIIVPGRFALFTDDSLIPPAATPGPGSFQGAWLRDGVPVGRRVSTPFFDFPDTAAGAVKQALDMGGTFDVPGSVTATIDMPAAHRTNPFLHQYHPDHGPADSFAIKRQITLQFQSTADRSAADADFDTVGGTYTETISGLHHNDIVVAGPFQLNRVVTTPELNQ